MSSNLPKFTPGPWRWQDVSQDGGRSYAFAIQASPDRIVFAIGDNWKALPSGADARLISAAPEMYEALRALRECETQYVNGTVLVKAGTANLDAVCAALAKAEGRA